MNIYLRLLARAYLRWALRAAGLWTPPQLVRRPQPRRAPRATDGDAGHGCPPGGVSSAPACAAQAAPAAAVDLAPNRARDARDVPPVLLGPGGDYLYPWPPEFDAR